MRGSRQFLTRTMRLWAHVAGRDRVVVALDCEILGIESAAGDHNPPPAIGDPRRHVVESAHRGSHRCGWDVTAGVQVNPDNHGHG
jgi:hypothetical protein